MEWASMNYKNTTVTLLITLLVLFSLLVVSSCDEKENAVILQDNIWIQIDTASVSRKKIPSHFANRQYMFPETALSELEKIVKEAIGEKPYPDDYLYFIKPEIYENPAQCKDMYPKAIIFSFATPKIRELVPYSIFEISLDGRDISDQVFYRNSWSSRANTQFYVFQGVFNPKCYIDTNRKHNFKISLTAKDGTQVHRDIEFSMPENNMSDIKSVGFDLKTTGQVVEIDDETLIPLGRSLHYETNEPIPARKQESVYIMDNNYFKKWEERRSQYLYDITRFPNDAILFLEMETVSTEMKNPPDFFLHLFLPLGDLAVRDLLEIRIDNKNVTDDFNFSQFAERHKAVDLCTGYYTRRSFLDPAKEHTLELLIKPDDGNTYTKKMTFTVPEVEAIKLSFSGYSIDMETRREKRDELQFNLFTIDPDRSCELLLSGERQHPAGGASVTLDSDAILNPANWKFNNPNDFPMPNLLSVELVRRHQYKLNFDADIPRHEKRILVKLQLPNGVNSDETDF